MKAADITATQLNAFSTIERVGSCLSLIGCLFIAVTFLGSKAFHKPINRLVFYASMGNIFTNVATTMARAAVESGKFNGFACQLQGFLIQMFMPADAYWTFAMALNVLLTFYYKYGADQLRRLEKWYFLCCYGFPFVPAFVYIWVSIPGKGRMYGNATLWCWIAAEWDIMRIATFYGPVWCVILGTITIYVRAGKDIFIKRQQLRNFSVPPPDPIPIIKDPFSSVKTTDIYITTESAVSSSDDIDLEHLGARPGHNGYPQQPSSAANRAYSVTITGNQAQQPPLQNVTRFSYTEKAPGDRKGSTTARNIPPSAHANFAGSNLYPTRKHAAMEANTAIWSYTKVAVLFFFAMMITWIPSSANRVYSVVHPGEVSLPLEYASAFVLPLQGFWNALIYATTSLPACKEVWTAIRSRRRLSGGGLQTIAAAFSAENDKESYGSSRHGGRKFMSDSESMTELQSQQSPNSFSRPTTKEGR